MVRVKKVNVGFLFIENESVFKSDTLSVNCILK